MGDGRERSRDGAVRPAWVWKNGELVPHREATFHVAATALHFGPAAFEGIRAYGLPDGRVNVFRARAHLERLTTSAQTFGCTIPFSVEELERACVETARANDHHDAYLRPIAFAGGEGLGFGRPDNPTEVCVLSFPWDGRHLASAQRRGLRAHVTSVRRAEGHPSLSKAKVSANYAAGLLAAQQARRAGFDEALLLAGDGAVAEAATSNVFAVWGDRLVTPPGELPILRGVTRDAVLTLARELGIEASEERFSVGAMAEATEVFLCGTTSEITPVREIDGRPVGDGAVGPITRALLDALSCAIRGEGPDRGWGHWSAPTP